MSGGEPSLRGFNDRVQKIVKRAIKRGAWLEPGGQHPCLVFPNGNKVPIHAFRRDYGGGINNLERRIDRAWRDDEGTQR